MTENSVIVSFSKAVPANIPKERVGIDLNEKSAVLSNGTKYDLSEVARLHTEYGLRRRDFFKRHPHDNRIRKKFSSSRREKRRVRQILHKAAKEIVESAKSRGQALVLEKLKGIRYVHGKRSGDSKSRRRRISQWPFRVLQADIVYKANWEGVPVEFVSADSTSQICSRCHYVNRKLKLTEKSWLCPQCGCQLDRDLNAAINIERRGKTPCLGVVRPGAQGTDEAVKGNEQTPAPILRAEVLKST